MITILLQMNCVNDSHMIVGGLPPAENDQHCVQVQMSYCIVSFSLMVEHYFPNDGQLQLTPSQLQLWQFPLIILPKMCTHVALFILQWFQISLLVNTNCLKECRIFIHSKHFRLPIWLSRSSTTPTGNTYRVFPRIDFGDYSRKISKYHLVSFQQHLLRF